jgi:hypothetical protein
MSSSFAWVDFSEEERQKMMEVLYLFREREIREELGVGTVRDAFSDILFPGTSTLHTRAKYMLFLPWIYLDLERRRTSSSKMAEYSRWEEINLINSLLDSREEEGVIGRVAKRNLKILPSFMYWSGLGIWGIRRFNGSLHQYFRYLDSFYFYSKNKILSDDKEIISGVSPNWDPNIVKRPKNFPKGVSLELSYQESEYLRDRIRSNCSDSLLAFLVDKTKPTDVSFIWQHPQSGMFSDEHKKIIWHARNFSGTIHGAALLYNLMLSELIKNQEWIEKYRTKIERWATDIEKRFNDIRNWDLSEFWRIVSSENRHIPFRTIRFIEQWIQFVKETKNLRHTKDNEYARKLIYNREVEIKRNRSRLKNPQMLKQYGGAAGADAHGFRWSVAKRILHDILKGLRRKRD